MKCNLLNRKYFMNFTASLNDFNIQGYLQEKLIKTPSRLKKIRGQRIEPWGTPELSII